MGDHPVTCAGGTRAWDEAGRGHEIWLASQLELPRCVALRSVLMARLMWAMGETYVSMAPFGLWSRLVALSVSSLRLRFSVCS